MSQQSDDNTGCFILLTVAMIGFGAGMIWGANWGLLTAGVTLLGLFLAVLIYNRGRG